MSDTLQEGEDAPILDHDAREECSEPDCPCHEWSKRELTKEIKRVKGNQWAIDPYSSCEVIELDYAPPHLADRIAQTYGESKEQRAQRAEQIVTEHNQHQSLMAEQESFARLLKAAKFLLAMNATNYDRDVMRSEGGFDALQKAVDTIEKGPSA